MSITNGKLVTFYYTLYAETGEVLDSNVGQRPLSYRHGSQDIIPGLQRGLEGHERGEHVRVVVPPEEAYGVLNPDAYREVPKAQLPQTSLAVGTVLQAEDREGNRFLVRVHEVRPETVVLDLNHPLAGKTLVFEVDIVDVQDTA